MVTIDQALYSHNSTLQNQSWVIDSGASSHMTNQRSMLYDVIEDPSIVEFGNKEKRSQI